MMNLGIGGISKALTCLLLIFCIFYYKIPSITGDAGRIQGNSCRIAIWYRGNASRLHLQSPLELHQGVKLFQAYITHMQEYVILWNGNEASNHNQFIQWALTWIWLFRKLLSWARASSSFSKVHFWTPLLALDPIILLGKYGHEAMNSNRMG